MNMNADTARMHRLTLRFAGASLETAVAEEQARKTLKPFRAALLQHGFALTARGAVEVERKGAMHAFLPMAAACGTPPVQGVQD